MATSTPQNKELHLVYGDKTFLINVGDVLQSDVAYASAVGEMVLSNVEVVTRSDDDICKKTTIESLESEDFKWTHASTLLLISIRQEMNDEFLAPGQKKNKLWQRVAEKIKATMDVMVTGETCDIKWRNLIQRYRKIKDKLQRTDKYVVSWRYFSAIDEILGDHSSVQPNPATLVESELPNTHRGPTLYISSVNRSSADSSIREDGGSKTNATNRVGGKEVTERKRPPDWFVEYLEHRNEVRKKRREEDLEREARRMKIEEEKLEAFKKMTKLLEEFLKRQ